MKKMRIYLISADLILIVLLLWLLTLTFFAFSNFTYNLSQSAPIGVWLVNHKLPVVQGQWVQACIPEQDTAQALARDYLQYGNCPGGAAPVIKRLAAAGGDTVLWADESLIINGQVWPASHARQQDGNGRILKRWKIASQHLAQDQYLLLSKRPDSYDSRYFGPLRNAVRIVPVFVYDKSAAINEARP